MLQLIKPGILDGTVRVQSSLNSTLRAVVISSLADGVSTIKYPCMSTEIKLALDIIKMFGSKVEYFDDYIIITGLTQNYVQECRMTKHTDLSLSDYKLLDCKGSAMCFRTFAAYALLLGFPVTLKLDKSIFKFSVNVIEDGLTAFSIPFKTDNENCSISFCGIINSSDINLDASHGSQFVSGVLMLLPLIDKAITIHVPQTVYQEYINLTLDIMHIFGAKIDYNLNSYIYSVLPKPYQPCIYEVEGDWTFASFFLVAGAIAGIPGISVTGLKASSHLPDREIISFLKQAGCRAEVVAGGYKVRASKLNAFSVDINSCPNLIPALFALATRCNGESLITGIETVNKFNPTLPKLIVSKYNEIGVCSVLDGDTIRIKGLGANRLSVKHIDCAKNSFLIMSLMVAATAAANPVEIEGIEALNNSFPYFVEQYMSLFLY